MSALCQERTFGNQGWGRGRFLLWFTPVNEAGLIQKT